MDQTQRIGIKMTVDANSAHTELPRVGAEFDSVGEKAKKAGDKAAPAFKTFGTQAEFTAQQLRMVGPQITDIVTGLITGQAPMTVLLQQGGQLHDMFGGFSPALRAVAGAFSLTTLAIGAAAAAGATLVYSWTQGQKQSQEFRNAIILTGNAAGYTEGKFNDLIARSADVANVSASASREVAQAFLQSGTFTGTGLEVVTTAALRLQAVSGKTSEDVISDFMGMSKGVADWAARANEQYHFVNAAQYAHIKALEDDNQKQQAMIEVGKLMIDHLAAQQQQLNGLGRAIQGVAKAWGDLKDAAASIGRETTVEERLKEERAKLERFAQPIIFGGFGENGSVTQQQRKLVSDLEIEQADLNKRTAGRAQQAAQEQATIARQRALTDVTDKLAGANTEYTKTVNVLAKSLAAGDISQVKFQQLVLEARQKYNPTGESRATNNSAAREANAQLKLDLEDIRASFSATESALSNGQQILEAQHAAGLVEDATYYQARKLLMQQMAQAQIDELKAENDRLAAEKLKGQDAIDRDRQVAVNRRQISEKQAELSAKEFVLDTQATSALNGRTAALLAARQAAQDYLAVQEQQQNRDLANYGQGSRQRSLNAGLNQIQDRYAQQRQDLENSRAQLVAQQDKGLTEQQAKDFQDRLALIDEFQARALGSYRSYYEQLGVLQSDWKNGAAEALADYADQAANVADGTKTLFTDALTGIEDVFVDLATKGKASFSDLATSILADIVRIEARIAISAAAQYIANAIGFSFGSAASGAGTVSGGSGLKLNAAGDVYRSHSLSAYSGTVVNRPTVFAFAAGAGLMGEAGPEGIFPLKRNSAGQLGVVATTAPQQVQQPTVTVNNYMGQDAQASVTQDDQGNIRVDFERRVLATVAGDMAAGGQTARATAGRMGLNNGATVRRRRG